MKQEPSNPQPRQLKPEQAAAAQTLDRHLSVTAGPGSGKTFVLVERYLEILRTKKVSVDNIVAITFTNRAANEMRQRVRGKIDALLRATKGSERQTWLRHKRSLEGAVITTIHGFCSRLLHEFPVEANIDPQFMLLDEHQSAMLLEAVVEEALADAIHHGNGKIVQLAQGTGRATLASALVELHRKYRGEGLSPESIEKLTGANHATEADYESALKELDAHVNDLLAARKLTKAAEEKRNRAAKLWPSLRAILAQPPTEQSIAAYCQAIEDFRETRLSKNNHPAVERMDEMLWGSDNADRLRGRVPATGFDLLAKHYSLALLKLLGEIDRRLNHEKQRLSVLDFDDLQLRALKLLELPAVVSRGTERYRYFLIDEFQDTNGLQRDLMTRLALIRGANLFIVGDRKQSVYGFRGADVDVFSEMSAAIESGGGAQLPLHLNFRSQPPLIASFNFLFAKIFQARADVPRADLGQLGFVEHEPSRAERAAEHEPPLVELLVSALPEIGSDRDAPENEGEEERDPLGAQERDAEQVAARIRALTQRADIWSALDKSERNAGAPSVRYGDVAILLRAFTGVWTYESALRRAGIPYLTVQGKGFYQREEITDLIQLLRFLDNTTDELALAAVLRSPLGGISDNALLAMRCAPMIGESSDSQRLQRRKLERALRRHRDIQFIDEADHVALERVALLLDALIPRRNRYGIAELLRYAVAASEFMTVIAANFDGAQRVANVEKLFRLAEQFEKSGHLIRDFVRFVEEFEAIGGREGEGQMDESANVVRLMTIHQAKGLEFPVVIIPDLHRDSGRRENQFILDRHKGLTVRIPDGRGQTVRGALFNELRQRNRWREEFESMRLLYVAATRAEDRLIFSGAVAQKELKNLSKTNKEQWLAWIWQALELDEFAQSGLVKFYDEVQVQLTLDRERLGLWTSTATDPNAGQEFTVEAFDSGRPFAELFPLLSEIRPEPGQVLRRFSVTQLINFQRCGRQYYFERTLKAPGKEERAVWNDAEAPEPPANLTATLKGAVIHRFCETFRKGDDPAARLLESFEDVVAQRLPELAGRGFEIDPQQAVLDLMPLARHYLDSDVFRRVTAVNRFSGDAGDAKLEIQNPKSASPGLWSELRFRLRRPVGILTGTIDKLLITPCADGKGFDVEIIDFKTNRFRSARPETNQPRATAAALPPTARRNPQPVAQIGSQHGQGFFDFDGPDELKSGTSLASVDLVEAERLSITDQAQAVAHDYQLQMQAYALALHELLGVRTGSGPISPRGRPAWDGGSDWVDQEIQINSLRATLHFIDPEIEISLPAELLDHSNCARAIDEAMLSISALDGTLDPERFPPLTATHCRICNFLELCPAGREWLKVQNRERPGAGTQPASVEF